MACEEAELGPDGFEQKMKAQQQLQEQVMSDLVTIKKTISPRSMSKIFECAYCSN